MASITGWSDQQIIDFLLKYPTWQKATAAGQLDTYTLAACSPTGQWFLPIHAQNRLNAGDTNEYHSIMDFLAQCPSTAPSPTTTVQPTPTTAVLQPAAGSNWWQGITAVSAAAMPSQTPPPPGGTPSAPVTYQVTETAPDYSGLIPGQAAPTADQSILGGMSLTTVGLIALGAYLLFGRKRQ